MKILLTLLLTLILTNAFGQNENGRIKNYNTKQSLALDGYDPVSYFDDKPTEGNKNTKFNYNGVVYLFSSQINLNRFKINPARYEPAYGGWCAYAMGESGEKVKIDPETYKIKDGKLYLFYNFWGNNTLEDWNKNEEKLKAKADKNWLKFIQ